MNSSIQWVWPYNCSLKIRESIGTLIPKVETHLGVCGFILSHPPTFPRAWNVTLKLHFRPAPLEALVLVVSPKLRSQHWQWAFVEINNLSRLWIFGCFLWKLLCFLHSWIMFQPLKVSETLHNNLAFTKLPNPHKL
jgi:hypothetical protein